MRLASSYLRSAPRRAGALGAGIAAAAAAFAVLGMNAVAATVQIRGSIPPASPVRAYDILVRPAGPAGQQAAGTPLTRPGDLTELSGGITLAQYDVIRRLGGVQIAAPMTMVGYVPLTITMSVPVSAAVATSKPQLLALTAAYRSDNGLSTVTQRDIGSAYVGGSPHGGTAHQRATVRVSVGWTFLLPLVAVDPAAEARLLLLDKAVIRGSCLPAAAAAPGAPVPMIMASSINDSDRELLSLTRLPVSPSRPQGGGRTAPSTGRLHGTTAGRTAGTATVTAAQAYRQLLGYLGEPGTARVPGYLTKSRGTYVQSANGDLIPQPVATDRATVWGSTNRRTALAVTADAEDVGFSSLALHAARTQGTGHALRAGAALTAVGVFDPGMLATSPATPSPYRGELLPGADQASRRLLGAQPLGPASNPAGYPDPAATLVMPLQDISAFTGSYTGTDARAPIASIRVRVASATGDDALSQERIRAVADEIVRATGLDVEVTLAATAVTRTVALPAGRLGRPPLRVREVWYRSDTATIVVTAIDPSRIALSALILLAGAAFFGNAAAAALRARRRDLATLTALGWRRRQLRRQLLQEFAAVALASGLLAAVAAAAIGAALGHRPVSGWAVLGLPAAVVMTIGAAWLPVRQAAAAAERHGAAAAARGTGARPRWRPWLGAVGGLRREPGRIVVGALVIAVACALLGGELALRWAFGGVLVGSVAGRPVSWLAGPGDVPAVLALLVMATITVADVDWLAAADRALEVRTLRAIGWPTSRVARLVTREAALLGIVGGVTAGVLDVVGCLAVAHQVPGRVLTAAAVAAGTGLLLSLVAAGLSAVIGRPTSVR